MALAALFPAPIAKIPVEAPETASPPAKTPTIYVIKVWSSTKIPPRSFYFKALQELAITGLGDVPIAIITVSTSK